MKIKNIVTVLLVAFILVSCTPTTPSVPIISSIISSPVPTFTIILPTPQPATETPLPKPTIEILDYPDTMADFNATVNFEVQHVVDVQIVPNATVYIRRWTPAITSSGETIAIPTAIEYVGFTTADQQKNSSMAYILSQTIRNTGLLYPDPVTGKLGRATDFIINSDLDWLLQNSPYAKGSQNLNFLTGDTAEQVFHFEERANFSNPFVYFLDGDLANRMITFANSGGTNVSVLIRLDGIPHPVAFAFYLQGPAKIATPVSP